MRNLKELIKESKIYVFAFLSILLLISSNGFDKNMSNEITNEIKFFPIGDSYTIGEGAGEERSWTSLLTTHLNNSGVKVKLIANPARTGYTTQNAIDNELALFIKSKPDFATLLIGVNDWVQGIDEKTFRKNLIYLIEEMQKAMSNKSKLLLITIPDFSVAPSGSQYARGRNISDGLKHFNNIISEEAAKRNLKVVDIFDLSKDMGKDASLVADDGLHPSAKEYSLWEEKIFPIALSLLTKGDRK